MITWKQIRDEILKLKLNDRREVVMAKNYRQLFEKACKRAADAENTLEAIMKYEPKEICKDEFAYDRLVNTYRECCATLLGVKAPIFGDEL